MDFSVTQTKVSEPQPPTPTPGGVTSMSPSSSPSLFVLTVQSEDVLDTGLAEWPGPLHTVRDVPGTLQGVSKLSVCVRAMGIL